MSKRPDLRDLVGEDVSPEELERLRRAHELLLQAGPPPELPPSLAEAPSPGELPDKEELGWLPPRRTGRILTLAAGFAALALALGYLVGRGHGGFDTDFTIAMHGTGTARQAQAVIKVAKLDKAGNWPLELEVSGLKELPSGGYYELWLTKGKRPAVSCGTFRVHEGDTTIRLNAPYNFKRFKPIGWIVTQKLPGKAPSKAPLLTT
jgi:Anti-sigma-K factor rskA, C-terminal